MDIIASAKEYMKRILNSVSEMKILLLDPETIGILGMCFSKTEVMEHEVFLFDLIEKERPPMPHLKAVCFLRPTRENVAYLAKDIAEPKYCEYHVFFSNIISDSALRDLAEADEHDMIQQVHEYYVDYFPEYRSIFSLGLDTMVAPNPDGLIGRICDGLSAVLLSLKKKPMIRYQRNSEVCSRLATELGRRMSAERSLFEFPRTELTTTLLIIDRREDPVTPLLTQWTYQAMVHESFGLALNRVDMRDFRKKKRKSKKGESSSSSSSAAGPSAEKEEDNTLDEIVLSSEQDEFYRENMFMNWGQLGINVQRATAELQQKDASVRNMQSIDDMKEFMEKIPEYNKLKGTVSKHVVLLGDLLDYIQERRLYDVSALEQELACRDNQDIAKQKLMDMLRNPSIHKDNKLRLVMLYVLRYEKVDREYPQLFDMLSACGCENEEVVLVKILLEYAGSDVRGNDLYGNQKSWSDSFLEKVAGLKGVENIYTQHKPFVNRLIEDLVMGQFQMRENAYPILGGGQPKGTPRDLIIFFVGGTTYEEVINAVKYATSPDPPFPQGVRIIVGGTCIHNSKSFLKEMRARYESTLRKII